MNNDSLFKAVIQYTSILWCTMNVFYDDYEQMWYTNMAYICIYIVSVWYKYGAVLYLFAFIHVYHTIPCNTISYNEWLLSATTTKHVIFDCMQFECNYHFNKVCTQRTTATAIHISAFNNHRIIIGCINKLKPWNN